MFDLFIIATCVFALIISLTLVALKMSLRSERNIPEGALARLKNKEMARMESEERTMRDRFGYCKVLSFLVRNYSFLDLCMSNKSKNKLSTLVSLSAIGNLCLVNPSLFINSLVGIPITVAFVVAQVCFQVQNADVSIMDGQVEEINQPISLVKEEEPILTKNKMLFIVFSLISIGLSLYMGGVTFKNYSNSMLSHLLINFAVNSALDVMIIRPIGFVIFSIPLSLNSKMISHIDNERLKECYAEQEFIPIENIGHVGTSFSPKKRIMNSPSKIPKALGNKENIDCQAIKSVLEIAKKIKREKIVNENLIRPLGSKNEIVNRYAMQEQETLNELYEEMNKNIEGGSPIKKLNESSNVVEEIFEIKDNDVEYKKDVDEEREEDNDLIKKRGVSCLHSNLDFEDDINRQEEEYAYERQMNFIKLNQHKEEESDVKTKENSTLNIERFDQFKIYNNEDQPQIEEIDTNSPDRRRQRQTIEVDSSEFKLKKKSKMHHGNGNVKKRVIKYSSGEPYLEYLPNMLVKEQIMKHKKSQPITSKLELESIERGVSFRKANSRKQINKINYGGDENYYPGTLEVEDL